MSRALQSNVYCQFLRKLSKLRQKAGPTLVEADRVFDEAIKASLTTYDANDLLYALEASHDYDPAPGLEQIIAPLLAINFADDLINPPELGILEQEIKRVTQGRAITMPATEATMGHDTHMKAILWKHHLEAFFEESASSWFRALEVSCRFWSLNCGELAAVEEIGVEAAMVAFRISATRACSELMARGYVSR